MTAYIVILTERTNNKEIPSSLYTLWSNRHIIWGRVTKQKIHILKGQFCGTFGLKETTEYFEIVMLFNIHICLYKIENDIEWWTDMTMEGTNTGSNTRTARGDLRRRLESRPLLHSEASTVEELPS